MRNPTTPLARRLRQEATTPEARVWSALRGGALGVKFRRQHPIGPYVTDFACVERKLVVELDGGVHRVRELEDALRTEELERMGWTVLRIPNETIMADLSGALTLIQDALRP